LRAPQNSYRKRKLEGISLRPKRTRTSGYHRYDNYELWKYLCQADHAISKISLSTRAAATDDTQVQCATEDADADASRVK